MAMSFSNIGGLIGSFIGSNDLEDQFDAAIAELQKFRQSSEEARGRFQAKGDTAFNRGLKELTSPTLAPDVAALRAMLVTNITSGLSPFAQLQFEDLNRLLEERQVATGNLRSGSIGTQRAELGRRIAADEFGRALETLETLQTRDLTASQMFLNTALGYGNLENQSLATQGATVGSIAKAMVGKGVVQQQAAVAIGAAAGGLFEQASEMVAAYYTGGASGLASSFGKGGGS